MRKPKKNFKVFKDMNSTNIRTLEEFTTEYYGAKGTPERDKFDEEYAEFKLGALIHEARLEKGLTQEQLADKSGISKGYIAKVENNIKDVQPSTLRKIVEIGLGWGSCRLRLGVMCKSNV